MEPLNKVAWSTSNRDFLVGPDDEYQDDYDSLPVLANYKYSTRYEASKGPRRRKRYIICGYDDCKREFTKAWNFLDHARMHTGEKPYACDICDAKFTQKGNLTKHMKKHSKSKKRRRRRY